LSPYRIDEINGNFPVLHPEIIHDIRGFVVLQIGQLEVRNDTYLSNILRYLNENRAAIVTIRPFTNTDVGQPENDVNVRTRNRYQVVKQVWDYDK